jgi:hypothetical protein
MYFEPVLLLISAFDVRSLSGLRLKYDSSYIDFSGLIF